MKTPHYKIFVQQIDYIQEAEQKAIKLATEQANKEIVIYQSVCSVINVNGEIKLTKHQSPLISF